MTLQEICEKYSVDSPRKLAEIVREQLAGGRATLTEEELNHAVNYLNPESIRVRHILITHRAGSISLQTMDGILQAMPQFGFRCLLVKVSQVMQERAFEVYSLDNLTSADLQKVEELCSDANRKAG